MGPRIHDEMFISNRPQSTIDSNGGQDTVPDSTERGAITKSDVDRRWFLPLLPRREGRGEEGLYNLAHTTSAAQITNNQFSIFNRLRIEYRELVIG